MVSISNNLLTIWDTNTLERLRTLDLGAEPISNAIYSPDGLFIVGISQEKNMLIMWDANTLERLHTLSGHTYYIDAVVFTTSGRFLVSAGQDGTVRVWGVSAQ